MNKKLPSETIDLGSSRAGMDRAKDFILQGAISGHPLQILEAGCGRRWSIDLHEIQYVLTGVDLDENALDIRKNQRRDLDIAILDDLRTVSFSDNSFDIIFSNNVLEHIKGAEAVLRNFISWLKPGGIMILMFPNRNSGFGFLTRTTPLWVHVVYKKYVQGFKNAGKPGYDPYPVYFEKVVSRGGIYEFCENNGLVVRAEFRMDGSPMENQIVWFITKALLWSLYLFSLRKLTFNYRSLLYVIEKP